MVFLLTSLACRGREIDLGESCEGKGEGGRGRERGKGERLKLLFPWARLCRESLPC